MTTRAELENPNLFENCQCGVYYPDGWSNIVEGACRMLSAIKESQCPDLEIDQIKEKFARLCIYTNYDGINNSKNDDIKKIIYLAENLCAKTCQVCGAFGKIENQKLLIKVVCDKHKSKT